jgi:hypothetical protein
VNFIALAITYLTLHAEFLAVIQIVVYSGAILILFVFVIALLSSGVKPFEVGPNRMPRALDPGDDLCGLIGFRGDRRDVAGHASAVRRRRRRVDRRRERLRQRSPTSAPRCSPRTCCRSKSRRSS